MDRSKIAVTLALIVSLFSVLLGLVNIANLSRGSSFGETGGLSFISGRSGIALIRLYGAIGEGSSGSERIGADDVVRDLKQSAESPQVRAVILAINSPGGSVGATKKIYDAVMELRKSKPVFAVITDIAASGGYYIASACDKIYAYEGSILGSIGVISLHGDISGLLQKYGVKVNVIKAGRYKDASYPFRSMTAEELRMETALINDAYTQFIADVSEGRKQPIRTVRTWAEGRIFSGKKAKTEQIIDELGGVDEAVAGIKLMLKTNADLPIIERKRGFFEELFSHSPLPFSRRGNGMFLDSSIYYLHPAGFKYFIGDFENGPR